MTPGTPGIQDRQEMIMILKTGIEIVIVTETDTIKKNESTERGKIENIVALEKTGTGSEIEKKKEGIMGHQIQMDDTEIPIQARYHYCDFDNFQIIYKPLNH